MVHYRIHKKPATGPYPQRDESSPVLCEYMCKRVERPKCILCCSRKYNFILVMIRSEENFETHL
jgi:hypothetical protein